MEEIEHTPGSTTVSKIVHIRSVGFVDMREMPLVAFGGDLPQQRWTFNRTELAARFVCGIGNARPLAQFLLKKRLCG
jgi:hypothetical protein